MSDLYPPITSRKWLLIPVMPTPNGRLHLGHMAGPYLRMDILARHLRRFGHRVLLISGSDVHESFVLLKAQQTNESPEHVCTYFHRLIHRDLKALDIVCDAFINPLPGRKWSALYRSCNLGLVKRLNSQGATTIQREKFLYAAAQDRYIAGCWLLGKCPQCGSEAGSYFCEQCGAHFRPEDIHDPYPRLESGLLTWREVNCLYLKISDTQRLFSRMASMGVPEVFQQTAREYITAHGAEIRLTQPSHWGIPWQVPGETVSQVIFTYTALLAYALACGEIYGRLAGTGINAFDSNSGVTTIASFGIDNVVPFLIGCLGGALEHGAIKPFDHFLINYFYHLEGSKFSTSRGHVIWAGDIAMSPSIGSDVVRGYLAKTNPENCPMNFDLQDFIEFANGYLYDSFNAKVRNAWSQLKGQVPSNPPEQLLVRLRQALHAQERSLDPRTFQLSEAMHQVDTWIADQTKFSEGTQTTYWWLKGLALLAYPIMPKFGTKVWRALGHAHLPTVQDFTKVSSPQPLSQSIMNLSVNRRFTTPH